LLITYTQFKQTHIDQQTKGMRRVEREGQIKTKNSLPLSFAIRATSHLMSGHFFIAFAVPSTAGRNGSLGGGTSYHIDVETGALGERAINSEGNLFGSFVCEKMSAIHLVVRCPNKSDSSHRIQIAIAIIWSLNHTHYILYVWIALIANIWLYRTHLIADSIKWIAITSSQTSDDQTNRLISSTLSITCKS